MNESDNLPEVVAALKAVQARIEQQVGLAAEEISKDRKSTRLNSSH